jgi:hypothetical protein
MTRAGSGVAELVLDQQFQRVSGSVRVAGETLPLTQAALRGDEIRFAFAGEGGARVALAGRVAGDRIVGRSGAEPWIAVRGRTR